MRVLTAGLLSVGALTVALLAGCGSTPAQVTHGPSAAPAAVLPIATSLAGSANGSWAVVELGGPGAQHDNFWELFVRQAGARSWRLVTPPGVASNGGLAVAGGGGGASLFAAFGPSQQLTFSPLAATSDDGGSWSPGNPISPGLARVPDALAAGPHGQLLALADTGTVRLGSHDGANWRSVTSRDSLARTAAGRACGLASLSAVAFSAAGQPMAAGTCSKPGAAGLFEFAHGSWEPVRSAWPAALGHDPVTVVGLATIAGRTTALLAAGRGRSSVVMTAWTGGNGTGWTFSPVLHAGASSLLSQSLWPGGAAGLVLSGSRGEAIAGPGANWRQLARLPARTATLALGASGQLEALAASGDALTAWQLGTGSGITPASAGSGAASWHVQQNIKIQIPYGSSG